MDETSEKSPDRSKFEPMCKPKLKPEYGPIDEPEDR